MKPRNLPQSLIKEQAYQIYKRRIAQEIEGNSDDDWKAAIMYLEKHNWVILKWQFKQNLIRLGTLFFISLPKSDWVKLLAVPVVLSFAGAMITFKLQEKSRQYDLLDRYFKDLENVLLDKDTKSDKNQNPKNSVKTLSDKETNKNSKNIDLSSIIVKSKSFAILQSLDVDKKQIIIRFLAESNLIRVKNSCVKSDENITSNIDGVSLAYLDLKKINLNRLNLQQADFDNTDLSEAHLIRTDLSEASLCQANLYKTRLQGAKLKGAKLFEANLSESFLGAEDNLLEKIKQANNSGIPLSDSLARLIDLNTASLEFALLERANLSKSNLRGVNFTSANLREANLQKADLSGAKLEEAKLREADLSGADLNGAKLDGATLEMAILNGANLEEADFTGAKDLEPPQVKKAKNWEKAIYDPDLSKRLGLNSAHHPQYRSPLLIR
ncbi:MAG: pentapeptide repeat-containing protein [Merismopediaceae bacterium]|nr:pentapeptide repeat-containing protein [Merismopediaceae bacterium]